MACPRKGKRPATQHDQLLCDQCAQAFARSSVGHEPTAALGWVLETWAKLALEALEAQLEAKANSEAAIKRRIKKALGRIPWCHFERVQAGTDQTEEGHWVHYAEPGTPDLMGWVTVRRTLPSGKPWAFARMVGLEVKSAKGRLRDEQVLWARDCIEGGGYWAVVRSAEDAVEAVKRAALFETPALPPLPAPKPKAKPGKDWAALEAGIAQAKGRAP